MRKSFSIKPTISFEARTTFANCSSKVPLSPRFKRALPPNAITSVSPVLKEYKESGKLFKDHSHVFVVNIDMR
jgi:hypothetical protein